MQDVARQEVLKCYAKGENREQSCGWHTAEAKCTCIKPRVATVYACDRLTTALLAGSPPLKALHMHIVATLLTEGHGVVCPVTISL